MECRPLLLPQPDVFSLISFSGSWSECLTTLTVGLLTVIVTVTGRSKPMFVPFFALDSFVVLGMSLVLTNTSLTRNLNFQKSCQYYVKLLWAHPKYKGNKDTRAYDNNYDYAGPPLNRTQFRFIRKLNCLSTGFSESFNKYHSQILTWSLDYPYY